MIKKIILVFSIILFTSNPAQSQSYRTMIDGEFMGWNGHSAYLLYNGGLIIQKDSKIESSISISPKITLLKENNKLYALVSGVDDLIEVEYFSNFYKGKIYGEFTGWEDGKIYHLMDGHIIKQIGYNYHYEYRFDPQVIITKENNMNRIIVIGSSNNMPTYVSIIK